MLILLVFMLVATPVTGIIQKYSMLHVSFRENTLVDKRTNVLLFSDAAHIKKQFRLCTICIRLDQVQSEWTAVNTWLTAILGNLRMLLKWRLLMGSPKGGQGCLMSPPCLESQGCHLITVCYLFSCLSA